MLEQIEQRSRRRVAVKALARQPPGLDMPIGKLSSSVRHLEWALSAAGLFAVVLAAGCASPGPPRAPSLQLPAVVSDLQATRRGEDVELQFVVPASTTDGQPYRGAGMRATVCRAVDVGTCVPLPGLAGVPLPAQSGATGAAASTMLHDALTGTLASGAARLLTYRVALSNDSGRSAGFGDAAFTAGGEAPPVVEGLRAEGSRQGVVVRWKAVRGGGNAEAGDEVVLRRELVLGLSGTETGRERANAQAAAPSPAEAPKAHETTGKRSGAGPTAHKNAGSSKEPGVVWLSTSPPADPLGGSAPEAKPRNIHGVLDDSAAVNSTYRYAAERQQTLQLGGHTVVLHSALSSPVEVALQAVYPPPAPSDLVGTVFPLAAADATGAGAPAPAGLAVDLIWTPADDANTVGYRVFRELLDASGAAVGPRVSLTAQPVRASAFHDVLPAAIAAAGGSQRLRYRVVAVDANGLESAALTVVVETKGR